MISIIIPIYNVVQYLSRCIDSILAQTYTDIEILLIDDGSTDNSGQICYEYAKKDKRIKVFHKPNGGVSSARNLGLDNATGEWITFVDADDWIDKEMYQSLYNEAVTSQADIVLCDFYIYYTPDKKLLSKTIQTEGNKEVVLRNYLCSFTPLWNMLVSRSLYNDYRLRIPEHIIICEDFWLSVRLFYYARKISAVHRPFYFYNRENENSALNNLNAEKQKSECLSYLDTLAFFREKGMLSLYEKELSWRLLKCNQDMVLDVKKHNHFLEIYPESHRYILSCPKNYCNGKIKVLMWLLTHKMGSLVRAICKTRYLLKRNK